MKNELHRINENFWNTLEQVQLVLDASTQDMALFFEMTEKEYLHRRALRKSLPLSALIGFANRFNLSVEAVLTGKVDYRLLERHYQGEVGLLPERYTLAAYSKSRTVVNFLNYAQSRRGLGFRRRMLKQFQVSESAFASLDTAVNIHFLTDMLDYLRRSGFKDSDFFSIGLNTLLTNQRSPLHQLVYTMETPASVYETIVGQYAAFFDKNYKYSISRLTDTSCIIRSSPSEEVSDILKVRRPGNKDGCLQRAGAIATFPGYMGLPLAQVKETSCIHRGDSACQFEVDFDIAHRLRHYRSEETAH